MKKNLLTSFVQLDQEELNQLCSVVNETLATDLVVPERKEKRKSYGVNDLWSMRRTMKTAGRSWSSRTRNFVVRG